MIGKKISVWLGYAALAEPPPALRQRLLAQLDAATLGEVHVPATGSGWSCPLPGLEVRQLLRDVIPGRLTALARMAPGARYPRHVHVGDEELFMIAGDLEVEGRRMGPGDFCAARAGSAHREVHTEAGATFLMTAALDDRLGEAQTDGAGLHFAWAASAVWREAGGVARRALFHSGDSVTLEARLQPGATVCAGARGLQVYVLGGQARLGERRLGDGDFAYADRAHATQGLVAETPATLLLIDVHPDATEV